MSRPKRRRDQARAATFRSTAFTTPATRSPTSSAARSTEAEIAAWVGTRIANN